MTSLIAAIRDPNRCPSHPGDVLADMLDETELTKTALAERLHLSRQHVHEVLAGRKPVSPAVAARLGRFFGNGPGFWLRLQAAHDAWHAERETGLDAIRPYKAA